MKMIYNEELSQLRYFCVTFQKTDFDVKSSRKQLNFL